MKVIQHTHPTPAAIPGIDHVTVAGHGDGLSGLSVWRQSLAPAAATPPHSHDCDEIVMCHAGRGEVHSDGHIVSFEGESTVLLPKGHVHQIFNVGETRLEITGVFAQTPVVAYWPDGSVLQLPWRT